MPAPTTSPQYLHIVTVGTSLLINSGWQRGPRPSKATLLDLLKTDPRKHSAELNATIPFIDRGQCTRVHLLATDTPECRLCRDALGLYLHGRGIQTNQGHAAGLLPDALSRAVDQPSFCKAVCQFRDAVFRVADNARRSGQIVLINATGGIKAETTVAALVAAELGLSSYYIHESMAEPVSLPTAHLDPAVLRQLRRLQSAPSRQARPRILRDADGSRLEREGLIRISRNAEGDVSNIRLTAFAKNLLRRKPG